MSAEPTIHRISDRAPELPCWVYRPTLTAGGIVFLPAFGTRAARRMILTGRTATRARRWCPAMNKDTPLLRGCIEAGLVLLAVVLLVHFGLHLLGT